MNQPHTHSRAEVTAIMASVACDKVVRLPDGHKIFYLSAETAQMYVNEQGAELVDTYVVERVEDIGPHLTPVTVHEVACDTFVDCRCGDRTVTVQLGVPLCSGCDEAIGPDLDPCPCERPA
jgi:hypothetical protein